MSEEYYSDYESDYESELTECDFSSYSDDIYNDIPYMYKDEYGMWWDTRGFAENPISMLEEQIVTTPVSTFENEFVEMIKGLVVIIVIGIIASKF